MAFVTHRTKKLGWEYEVNEGVDPIGNADPYYNFGQYPNQPPGDFPKKSFTYQTSYAGGRDPASIRIANAKTTSIKTFAPTNGLPVYQIYGDSTTAAGLHTLDGIDTGELPTITERFQSENAAENIRYSMVGAKTGSLQLAMDNLHLNIKAPLICGQTLKGLDVLASTSQQDKTPVYPTSKENMYFKDANFSLVWDTAHDYSDVVKSFKYICDTSNLFQPLMQQLNPHTILEGFRAHIFLLEILRGDDKAIYTDYLAQTRASTGGDLVIKVYNSATEYIELDASGVFIDDCVMNYANDAADNELELYTAILVATSVVPKIKDGVADSFYGE